MKDHINQISVEEFPFPLLIVSALNYRILYANSRFHKSLGYDADDLIGENLPQFIVDAGAHEELKTGAWTYRHEIRANHKKGHEIWISISQQHIEYDSEPAILSIVEDISARKSAESAVERLVTHNELILSSAGEGIYGLDSEGKTTFVNPAAADILGWTRDELLGKPQHVLVHHSRPDGSNYPRKECPIYAAFSDGQVHTVDDEVFWRKDGTPVSVEYTSTPIRNESGKLAGAVVTFRDITVRKKAEEDLKTALEELQSLKDRLEAENTYLQEEIKLVHNFDEIIGSSESFTQVLSNVEKVASTDATVLILGETGTGKELIARAVHRLSPRKDRPLVKVNCAALPSELIESELFGHEKGAFTNAVTQRSGRFELADSGTIFLDEIGDLPLEQQAKLLRVLQESEFERVGGSKTLSVDVRVIAATNVNLSDKVEAGEFREDLFYRLNVFPLSIPPLRERPEDVALLAQHFIEKYSRKMGRTIDKIPTGFISKLQTYQYQGNVRELENLIERAVILATDGTLQLEHELNTSTQRASTQPNGESLDAIQRAHILSILEETGWRIEGDSGAAVRLELKASTLRSRMQKLGIRKPLR